MAWSSVKNSTRSALTLPLPLRMTVARHVATTEQFSCAEDKAIISPKLRVKYEFKNAQPYTRNRKTYIKQKMTALNEILRRTQILCCISLNVSAYV